jgi:Domain of Unknown Function with PDB structure (DUF3857)
MRSIAVIRFGVLPLCGMLALSGVLAWRATEAATPPWRVGTRETWVVEPPRADVPLHDRQIRVTADGDDRYEHSLQRLAITPSDEQVTPITVDLDPRYQELVVHSLRLRQTDGVVRSFTAAEIRDLIRTQDAEAEPRRRALDPRLQITLLAPGAHAGGLLECEYTVHSRNARFPGLFAGHYAAQWESGAVQPVQWERLRVIWPTGRALRFRISGGPVGHPPRVLANPGELDIEWHDPAPVPDQDLPRWFESRSTVQLSDFADWKEVAALLATRYAVPAPREDAPFNTAPGQILATLRLVQSKVYAARVGGTGAYAPAEPEAVLRQGFGDGRDLARLLVCLLQGIGVDARVALADSRHGALLNTRLPSPFILDTALVLARAGGKEYWLDPAAPAPDTALTTTDPADLRHALLLGTAGEPLVVLPQPPPDASARSVTQHFDLRAGNSRPATLTVTTLFQGRWAQAERAAVATQSAAERQLAQIQGVAADYPTAVADGDVQLQDEPAAQRLALTARFRVPKPFGTGEDPGIGFFAEALAGAVEPRDEPTRQAPLGVPWPFKVDEHIEALLPPDIEVPASRVLIETPAYRYQRNVRFSAGVLRIDHSYVALSDHVDPAQYPGLLGANERVYQALGVRVQPPEAPWRRALAWLGSRWWMVLAAAAAVTVATGIGRRLRQN